MKARELGHLWRQDAAHNAPILNAARDCVREGIPFLIRGNLGLRTIVSFFPEGTDTLQSEFSDGVVLAQSCTYAVESGPGYVRGYALGKGEA